MTSSDLPQDVFDAVKIIHDLQDKAYKSRMDIDTLNRAKLRVAFWACRSENIVASRENLAYVLGGDAKEIMSAYDRYLERDEDAKGGKDKADKPAKGKKGTTGFWENA